jgi:hypothetical protein
MPLGSSVMLSFYAISPADMQIQLYRLVARAFWTTAPEVGFLAPCVAFLMMAQDLVGQNRIRKAECVPCTLGAHKHDHR